MINEIERNKIHFGDGLDVMNSFPDKSIDHVICDLPFFGVVKDEWDNLWANDVNYLSWCRQIIEQYKRILKDNGNRFLFTGRQYNRKIATIMDEYFTEKRIIIWARKRNFNNTRGHALASGYEPICYYSNGHDGVFNNTKVKVESTRKEYTTGFLKDGITLSDVWSDIPALPHNSKEKLDHSTQKPIKLIERIVLLGTNPGDLILDNCSGSGTLAIPCIVHGRDYIMIEKTRKHYDTSITRVNNFNKQIKDEFTTKS